MCGIAGVVSRSVATSESSEIVARMVGALAHRGPDGAGMYSDRRLAMGMRRLSIIDLSGGNQPLFNERKTVALVANGEIYNFRELRTELESRAHHFRTGSDCEVIVHLYEELGIDCLKRLRGMFAFALWDNENESLLLARDRMGERPLYLAHQGDRLIFASELKGLLASREVPFEVNPLAVAAYFAYDYVPDPMTPIVGVRKLPAAHRLVVDVRNWQMREDAYWSIEADSILASNSENVIRETLNEVGDLVIRSDVPIGVSLSGGIDSSIVAALARRSTSKPVHAFSVGYEGKPECDERNDAQRLATHLGLHFHEVEISEKDVIQAFPSLIYWRDEPIGDIAGHGVFAAAQAARLHNVPVLLQGLGGDELFWGYPWVRDAGSHSQRKLRAVAEGRFNLKSYLRFESPPARSLYGIKVWMQRGAGLLAGFREWRRDQSTPANRAVFLDLMIGYRDRLSRCEAISGFDPMKFRQLKADSWPFQEPLLSETPSIDIINAVCRTYLIGNGLAQADRLAMACSIEGRMPLLDHRFVERSVAPNRLKPGFDLAPKAQLRAAVSDLLPDWVFSRPKRGFTPPVHRWKSILLSLHSNKLVDGYLVRHGLISKNASMQFSKGDRLQGGVARQLAFQAIILEIWCRFMSGDEAPPPSAMSVPLAKVA